MADKIRTDISVNYGLTGETRESVIPEKCIPRKKINIKSLDTSPTRKDPIPNQDKNTSGIQKINAFHHTYLHFLLGLNH